MSNKSGIHDDEGTTFIREAQELKAEWIRKIVITYTKAGADIDEAYILAWDTFDQKFHGD